MTVLLGPDDMRVVIPRSILPLEVQIIARFNGRDCDILPTDFIGIETEQHNSFLRITIQSYIDNIPPIDYNCTTLSNSSRPMTDFKL